MIRCSLQKSISAFFSNTPILPFLAKLVLFSLFYLIILSYHNQKVWNFLCLYLCIILILVKSFITIATITNFWQFLISSWNFEFLWQYTNHAPLWPHNFDTSSPMVPKFSQFLPKSIAGVFTMFHKQRLSNQFFRIFYIKTRKSAGQNQ